MNQIIITGRITSDPELKYTQGGKAYARMTVAVDRKFKNKQGEKETDFIPVIFWEKAAELAGEYLRKGSKIGVIGELRTGSYEKDDGTKVKTSEVWGSQLEFLESKKKTTQENLEDLGEVVENPDDYPF